MTVRGAPAIGVAAAFGMVLADKEGVDLNLAAKEIKASRPTAINLFWAVNRVLKSDNPLTEAIQMYDEDIETNLSIGKYGSEIVRGRYNFNSLCAGALACVMGQL